MNMSPCFPAHLFVPPHFVRKSYCTNRWASFRTYVSTPIFECSSALSHFSIIDRIILEERRKTSTTIVNFNCRRSSNRIVIIDWLETRWSEWLKNASIFWRQCWHHSRDTVLLRSIISSTTIQHNIYLDSNMKQHKTSSNPMDSNSSVLRKVRSLDCVRPTSILTVHKHPFMYSNAAAVASVVQELKASRFSLQAYVLFTFCFIHLQSSMWTLYQHQPFLFIEDNINSQLL